MSLKSQTALCALTRIMKFEDYKEPTEEQLKAFRDRTGQHIARVQENLNYLGEATDLDARKLAKRGETHDFTKFEPELEGPYSFLTDYYRKKANGEEVERPKICDAATDYHIRNERHHPEFHKTPNMMGRYDLAEMVADWQAMADEMGTNTRDWADKNVGTRWQFNKVKTKEIYRLIEVFENRSEANMEGIRKIAIDGLTESDVSKANDDELRALWIRLNVKYDKALKDDMPVNELQAAGLITLREIKERELRVKMKTPLVESIEEFDNVAKQLDLHVHEIDGMLTSIPIERKAGHVHSFGDGEMTDLPVGVPVNHTHDTPDGGTTSPPLEPYLGKQDDMGDSVEDESRKLVNEDLQRVRAEKSERIAESPANLPAWKMLALAALGYEVEKQDEDIEEEWNEDWHKLLKPSGKFVYQHHWRGLSEKEKDLSDEELMQTGHSFHSDFRIDGRDWLWGFTVFMGTAEENRDDERVIDIDLGDDLAGVIKGKHPKSWLKVGKPTPKLIKPGEPGATSESWAKIFAMDSGTFRLGYANKDYIEIFFEADEINGRFTFARADFNGESRWLLSKPGDKKPYAETHDMDETAADLKQKGHKYMFWPMAGKKTRLINLDEYTVKKDCEKSVNVFKADDEKQIVYGVVLEPETVDAHGDIISAEEIERACHFYGTRSRVIGLGHKKRAKAELVENYIAPINMKVAGGPYGTIKKGSWVAAVHIKDKNTWKKVKAEEINAFSIGGFGLRRDEN